jgi:hypothetical protein
MFARNIYIFFFLSRRVPSTDKLFALNLNSMKFSAKKNSYPVL